MTWPRQIYVATTALGVYYTSNFSDPDVQPTWTAVNDGLPALDCREFWLDPFDPGVRQYVLLTASRTLYRRENGGAWTAILSPSDCDTLLSTSGCTIGGFSIDAAVDGRVWAVVGSATLVAPPNGWWALYSDDYGASWAVAGVKAYDSFQTYGLGSVRAQDQQIYFTSAAGIGSSGVIHFSPNGGANWGVVSLNWPGSLYPACLNPLSTDRAYTCAGAGLDLQSVTSVGGVSTMLQDDLGPLRWDSMWFDPIDVAHQRLVRNNKAYVSYDSWATVNTPDAIAPAPYSFAPNAGNDTDQMLVGLTLGTHVIGTLYGEADTTATGIAGANAGTAPYTDSIPNTCGGLAQMGIQAVPLAAHAYTYDVGFEDAVATGGVRTFGAVFEEAPATGGAHTSDVALE